MFEALGDLDPEVQAPLRVLRLRARIFRNGSSAAASAERFWRDTVQQAGEAGRLTDRLYAALVHVGFDVSAPWGNWGPTPAQAWAAGTFAWGKVAWVGARART